MKTTLQELLDFESELTRMFDSDERVAMAILERIRTTRKEMLQKEKDVMCDFVEYCDEANRNYQDTEESWVRTWTHTPSSENYKGSNSTQSNREA